MTDRAADNPLPVVGQVLHRLQFAGAEVLAADLARRLRERYRFVFLCLDDIGPLGQQLMGEGFKVVDLRRRPGIDLAVARRLRRAVRRYGIDLLHAHQYTPFFYAAVARRCGLGHHPPIVFTEHGRHYPDVRRARRVVANRVLLKPGDHVTAVGRFIRRMLIENEGLDPERIEVIANGIDPQRYASVDDAEARAAARQAMGVARDDEPIVLQVARFHPVKDHDTALRAFARVLEDMPSAHLVLVGDGERREAIERLGHELGIGPRVHCLGVREDVPALLPGADVFLLSSLSEGISVTLLEAMAARLPIAATAVGGNPEIVEHGRTGLLSPRGDHEALGHNLLALLRDPPPRRRMGDAGHARLLRHFTQQRMHAGYERVYERLIEA